MLKSVFSKMMGVGRATVFTVGLAMILAENIGALAESGQFREEVAMRRIGRRDLLLKRRDV
jgi:hypothetical protein